MADKIINGSIEVTGKIDNEVTNRFEKVYINELPQDIQEWLDSHFNSYSINLSGEELTYSFKYLYECLNSLNPSSASKGFSDILINSFAYGELSQSYCYYGVASTSIEESTYFVFDYLVFINEHPEASSFVNKNYVLCTLAGYPSSRTITVNFKPYFSDIKQAIIKDLLTNKGYQVILTEDKVQEKFNKEVASKVICDQASMTFPQYILPLRVKTQYNSIRYFDYANGKVLDSSGEVDVNLTINDSQVSFSFDGEGPVVDIEYMYFEGTPKLANTYKLYFPSVGTKLYKHSIVIKSPNISVSHEMNMTLITLSSTAIQDIYDLHDYNSSNYPSFKIRGYLGTYSTGIGYYDYSCSFGPGAYLNLKDASGNTLITITDSEITSFVDTVTEL